MDGTSETETVAVTLVIPAGFAAACAGIHEWSPEDARLALTAGARAVELCRGLAAEERAERRDGKADQCEERGYRDLRGDVALLTSRLDMLLGTAPGGGASSLKGEAGEAAVESLLVRHFPGAEVEPCGKIAGRGDFLLRRAGKPPLLIEVKNVARVQATDIEKFERDLANSGEARAGLLVSCTPRNLPRLGPFALRLHPPAGKGRGRPAIYLTNALATPAQVGFAVEVLDFLVPAVNQASLLEGGAAAAETEAAAEVVNRAYTSFKSQLAPLRRIRDRLSQISLDVQDLEATSTEAIAYLRQLWDSHPLLRDPAAAAEEVAAAERPARYTRPPASVGVASAPASVDGADGSAAEAVRRFIQARGKSPSRAEIIAECGITEAALRRAGGVRALTARAKAVEPAALAPVEPPAEPPAEPPTKTPAETPSAPATTPK